MIASPTENTIPRAINARLYRIVFLRMTNRSLDLIRNEKFLKPAQSRERHALQKFEVYA